MPWPDLQHERLSMSIIEEQEQFASEPIAVPKPLTDAQVKSFVETSVLVVEGTKET